jgi:murein DD-endopeptidase MepM/ murein hydrolase activator NlpD
LQAASKPQTVSGSGSATGSAGQIIANAGSASAGQIIANPGGGSFQCPVSGAAYSDNYGPRGSGFHYGIDMFAPTGTPLVAVKSGSVSHMPMNGAGGNEAYLSANDGNVYFYAHLSQYVGGPRSVAQGEVIGLVGSTGDAAAPHLHFEIRVGGANGSRIDPYPTLRSAGC